MADLPTVVTSAGLQPRTPAELRAALLALVLETNPGYTANLPGALVEDISSTDVGALTISDSARVEAVNSLTPYGANAFLLNQLGQVYGVQLGVSTNTSVLVIFSGPPGYVVAVGFTVSDGTYQYTVQDGGVVGSGGQSDQLFCLATVPGSWAIPANTVTQLVTSVPTGVTLTVTNPSAGTPGVQAETEESYRSRVLQAGLAASQGMATFLKTLLGNISGVSPRLISVRQQTSNWEVIVGGGDPYQVAYAIYTALFDISNLVGSVLAVTAITKASPGVVTTDLNHGYSNGQAVTMTGIVGMTALNGVPVIATVVDEKRFSIGVNTTGYATYVSGGVCSPNLRNIEVMLQDYPDAYGVTYVNPPQQDVTITLTWNTSADNFVSSAAVSQLGSPALVDYVNAIPVGAPINLFELQATFQEAIAAILSPAVLTRMVFAVSINGVSTPPTSGTGIIAGDPESYFLTDSTQVTIAQG